MKRMSFLAAVVSLLVGFNSQAGMPSNLGWQEDYPPIGATPPPLALNSPRFDRYQPTPEEQQRTQRFNELITIGKDRKGPQIQEFLRYYGDGARWHNLRFALEGEIKESPQKYARQTGRRLPRKWKGGDPENNGLLQRFVAEEDVEHAWHALVMGADVNAYNEEGEVPLVVAVRNEQQDMIDMLIDWQGRILRAPLELNLNREEGDVRQVVADVEDADRRELGDLLAGGAADIARRQREREVREAEEAEREVRERDRQALEEEREGVSRRQADARLFITGEEEDARGKLEKEQRIGRRLHEGRDDVKRWGQARYDRQRDRQDLESAESSEREQMESEEEEASKGLAEREVREREGAGRRQVEREEREGRQVLALENDKVREERELEKRREGEAAGRRQVEREERENRRPDLEGDEETGIAHFKKRERESAKKVSPRVPILAPIPLEEEVPLEEEGAEDMPLPPSPDLDDEAQSVGLPPSPAAEEALGVGNEEVVFYFENLPPASLHTAIRDAIRNGHDFGDIQKLIEAVPAGRDRVAFVNEAIDFDGGRGVTPLHVAAAHIAQIGAKGARAREEQGGAWGRYRRIIALLLTKGARRDVQAAEMLRRTRTRERLSSLSGVTPFAVYREMIPKDNWRQALGVVTFGLWKDLGYSEDDSRMTIHKMLDPKR